MKMNFINNAITTNANNKGSIWLVFSLFFLAILFGISMTLSDVSLKEQKVFLGSVNQIKLKNQSKLADYIIDRSIDLILSDLDNSGKPNVGFVDISTGGNIVKSIDPTSLDINSKIFSTDTSTNITSLLKEPGLQGNFVINSPNKIDIRGSTIYYTFSITSSINNIVNGINTFDSSSLNVTKSISCPPPSNGQGSMRALAKSELGSMPAFTKSELLAYQFPGLYCTCSDPNYPKTGGDGSCASNVSCSLGSLPNCKSCSTTVANICGGCNAGYYLSSSNTCLACPTTGVASCPTTGMFTCSSGYYRTATSTSCSLCTSQVGVATCDPNTGLPITCQAGYQLVGGSCNPCLPGTYNPTAGTSACISCSSGYYTSTSGQTACNTPCSNLGVNVASCSTIGAVTGCNAGYSLVNGACILCPTGCNSCTSATACTACSTGKYLYNGTCVSTCSTGTYASSGICNACSTAIANCSSCSSATSCTACSAGKYLYNGSCVSTCPAGTYIYNGSCVSFCPTGYYGYNGTCVSSCPTGYYGYNGNCVNPCPTGYYGANGLCNACPASCSICSSATYCTACSIYAYYYLYNGSCVRSCPIGYYASSSNWKCIACSTAIANCSSCSSGSFCTGCSTGYYVYRGSCVNPCPTNYYAWNGSSCISPCYTGYYGANGVCNSCSTAIANCSSCSSATNCTTCSTGYYAYNSSCVASCPTGYYGANGVCNSCSTAIANCSSCSSATNCTTCSTGYYIYNGSCVVSCPTGYGYNGSCVTSCPTGYYVANGVCNSCSTGIANCSICSSATYCTTCSTGYYLYNMSCVSTCPAGTSIFSGTCSACFIVGCAACKYCSNCPGNLTCTTCQSGYKFGMASSRTFCCPTNCAWCTTNADGTYTGGNCL